MLGNLKFWFKNQALFSLNLLPSLIMWMFTILTFLNTLWLENLFSWWFLVISKKRGRIITKTINHEHTVDNSVEFYLGKSKSCYDFLVLSSISHLQVCISFSSDLWSESIVCPVSFSFLKRIFIRQIMQLIRLSSL